MIIGYARVSTDDQNLDLQHDALKNAGCEKIYDDVMTGSKMERPGLEDILKTARPGDCVVVWRLDRLGRSLKNLIELVNTFEQQQISLKSLNESIDTSTPTGKLVFHVFGALSEFERNLLRERTNAGLMAARARGRKGGRPKKIDTVKSNLAQRLYNERKHTIKQICELMGISRPTLYRYITIDKEKL
jgi:DNA invertase Pin-like site-specific DNA recombinase